MTNIKYKLKNIPKTQTPISLKGFCWSTYAGLIKQLITSSFLNLCRSRIAKINNKN